MKWAAFVVVLALCVFGSRSARASDAQLPSVVLPKSEALDTWLHERCSYRGIELLSADLVARAGTVTELAALTLDTSGDVKGYRVKVFRCAEKPSSWTSAFVPAPAAAVRCEEESPFPKLCVPPLRRAVIETRQSAASAALVAAAELVTSRAGLTLHGVVTWPTSARPTAPLLRQAARHQKKTVASPAAGGPSRARSAPTL